MMTLLYLNNVKYKHILISAALIAHGEVGSTWSNTFALIILTKRLLFYYNPLIFPLYLHAVAGMGDGENHTASHTSPKTWDIKGSWHCRKELGEN